LGAFVRSNTAHAAGDDDADEMASVEDDASADGSLDLGAVGDAGDDEAWAWDGAPLSGVWDRSAAPGLGCLTRRARAWPLRPQTPPADGSGDARLVSRAGRRSILGAGVAAAVEVRAPPADAPRARRPQATRSVLAPPSLSV